MKELMDSDGLSNAELARRMKLSRARITQILNVLKLNPEVIEMIKEIVDRFNKPVITERRLRGEGRLLRKMITQNLNLLKLYLMLINF